MAYAVVEFNKYNPDIETADEVVRETVSKAEELTFGANAYMAVANTREHEFDIIKYIITLLTSEALSAYLMLTKSNS